MRSSGWICAITLLCMEIFGLGSAEAGGRRLMPSDVIQIKVVNQSELDTQARVEPDGTIKFPYVGRIRAAGLTEDALASRISAALERKDVVNEPQVLIEVTNFGGQVSVQGEVGLPGAITLDRPTTLTQVLSRAGGIKENAGTVVVRRAGPKGITVARYNAKEIMDGKVNTRKIFVQNNDEVYVELGPVFYLYGFVRRAGEYPLIHPLTVQQALAAGGGVSDLGSDWRIQIRRRLFDGTMQDVSATLDDEVQPSDTIVVNERIF